MSLMYAGSAACHACLLRAIAAVWTLHPGRLHLLNLAAKGSRWNDPCTHACPVSLPCPYMLQAKGRAKQELEDGQRVGTCAFASHFSAWVVATACMHACMQENAPPGSACYCVSYLACPALPMHELPTPALHCLAACLPRLPCLPHSNLLQAKALHERLLCRCRCAA
jgi:hypothetical protein